jgi:hypothetical protein
MMLGNSETVPVAAGKLALGTWQVRHWLAASPFVCHATHYMCG